MQTVQPVQPIIKRLHQWCCHGVLSPESASSVLLQVINFIGMQPGRKCRIDRYPFRKKGGKGYTLYQPLTDSYITADAYEEDINGEPVNQTVVILASCKDYDPVTVGLLLSKLIGPLVLLQNMTTPTMPE